MTVLNKEHTNKIYCGDALELAKTLPDCSVQCMITSPPYWNQRDYNCEGQLGQEATPDEYVNNLVNLFRELHRVLRDDGTLWLNLGDVYISKKCGNLKPKDLAGMPWRVAFALQDAGWYLRSDAIWEKCLSGGTIMYAKTQTSEAPMTIKDLVKLNPATVKLWNGKKWSQVVAWNEVVPNPERKRETQKRNSYKYRTGKSLPLVSELEIHLRSGEKIGCTQEHKFPTQRGLVEAGNLKIGDVLDSCLLPEPSSPLTPKYVPDKIGWFIGLYLAEGSMSGKTIQISGHVKEIDRWERLKKLAHDYGCTFRLHVYGNSASGNINGYSMVGLIDTYINGKLAKGKHLAPVCWKRSNVFLAQVLQGYLEGDGHFEVSNKRWRLGFTNNVELAQTLRTLSGRLGFSLRLKRTKNATNGKKFDGWRGSIKFETSNHWNTKFDTEIIKIEASRARKFWDITLKDEPHLFALASGVLTHNSNCLPQSMTDRPTRSHEYIFLFSKKARYFYDQDAIREPVSETAGAKAWRRIFDPTKQIKEAKLKDSGMKGGNDGIRKLNPLGRNRRTIWKIATQSYKGAHFSVFPEEIPRICILAGTSVRGCCPKCGSSHKRIIEKDNPKHEEGQTNSLYAKETTANRLAKLRQAARAKGEEYVNRSITIGWQPTCEHNLDPIPCVVLDPFMGSGTTAAVARKLGRSYIGFELNPEYIELAEERIALAVEDGK